MHYFFKLYISHTFVQYICICAVFIVRASIRFSTKRGVAHLYSHNRSCSTQDRHFLQLQQQFNNTTNSKRKENKIELKGKKQESTNQQNYEIARKKNFICTIFMLKSGTLCCCCSVCRCCCFYFFFLHIIYFHFGFFVVFVFPAFFCFNCLHMYVYELLLLRDRALRFRILFFLSFFLFDFIFFQLASEMLLYFILTAQQNN